MSDTVQQTIAAALTRENPLTAAECAELLPQVNAALQQAGERLLRVHPGDGHHPQGAEYTLALRCGTAEDVKALREEFERVQAQVDQLQAQHGALLECRSQARVREAFEGLPGLHRTLADHLAAAEAARDALDHALDDLDRTFTAIVQARGECHRGGVQGAGSPRENIERLLALGGCSTINRLAGYNGRLGDVFGARAHIERIGIEADPGIGKAA